MIEFEYEEEEFQKAYASIIKTVNVLGEHNVSPLMIAACSVTIGLSIYKTVLSEEDFEKMIEVMTESTDNLSTFDTQRKYMN